MSKRSQLPKLKCALHAKNAGRGPITDVSVLSVSLPFKQSSLNAISLEKVIIPPAGWSQATAALSGFSATYVDGDNHVLGIMTFVGLAELANGTIKIIALIEFRDNDGQETIQGWVDVLIQYFIR